MKRAILFLGILLLTALASDAQSDARFTVTVSTDSVLMGNAFQVRFTLENIAGGDFSAPPFSPDFIVVSGPNRSTSLSMINGQTTRTESYTYLLEPLSVGSYFIGPATVATNEGYLETEPIPIWVVANPDGIQQDIPGQSLRQERFFGTPEDFFNSDFWSPFRDGQEGFGTPFGEGFFAPFFAPDSLNSQGFPNFGLDMEEFFRSFGPDFFQQMPDSLGTQPFAPFQDEELDMEKLKKMFPGWPEELLRRFLPEGEKKKRKTWRM